MATTLTIRYDKVGGILFIDKCKPYGGQDSAHLDDDIVTRWNVETGEVENLEILFFQKRLAAGEDIKLPLTASFHLAVEA